MKNFILKHPFLTYFLAAATVKAIANTTQYFMYAVGCLRAGTEPLPYGYKRTFRSDEDDGDWVIEPESGTTVSDAAKTKCTTEIAKALKEIQETLATNQEKEENENKTEEDQPIVAPEWLKEAINKDPQINCSEDDGDEFANFCANTFSDIINKIDGLDKSKTPDGACTGECENCTCQDN